MKYIYTMAILICLTLTFTAAAHTSLTQSSPTNDAMLMQSPEQLSLTFSGEVRVAKVTLNNANNEAVDFAFKPVSTPNTQFDWDLPSLADGMYKAEWTVLGKDGHKMSGSFSFMVHGNSASMNMMKDKSDPHNH